MKYISRFFINNLLFKTDIVRLISSKINLQKIGNRYKCCCPFHKEKNPSFTINEEKKFFYCFGCKIYGNVIDFLMKFNNISFFDSIKELSEFNGIKLIINEKKNKSNFYTIKNKYFKLMFILANLYHKFLLNNKNLYLIKNFFLYRNINFNVIKKFLIGYSSLNLFKYLNKIFNNKEINFLVKFGVLLRNKDGYLYDRFCNRIIFPIFDLYGGIIAFGGRSIYNNNVLKYVNSSKNIFFSKKNCLYGLNYVKNKGKVDRIFIVEGYIDVITLHK